MNTGINLQLKREETMKKLNVINAKNKLNRDEMKKIMAGSITTCPPGEFVCFCKGDLICAVSISECEEVCL
jgi:hypothetical protein